MSKKSANRIPLLSLPLFIALALWLTIGGIALIVTGFAFPNDSIGRVVLHAVGGAVIGLGCIQVLHEWTVARKVRNEFFVLGDFIEKGREQQKTGRSKSRWIWTPSWN